MTKGEKWVLLICVVWAVLAIVRAFTGDTPTWITVAAAFFSGWTIRELTLGTRGRLTDL